MLYLASLFIPIETAEAEDIRVDDSLLPLSESKKLEIEAIKLAEQSTESSLTAALDSINEAIILSSITDSAYYSLLNNKAQILRLMDKNDEALHYLNQVLGVKDNSVINKKIIRQSSAQRGWLYFRAGNTEAAFIDFEVASKLGCLESKRMAVRCNPYAAMCNQMMQELTGSRFYSKSQ